MSDLPDRIHLTILGRLHFDDPALHRQMSGAPDGVTYWDFVLAWERRGMSREAQMRRYGWAP